VLRKLRAGNPKYNKAITFILVDWDTFRNKEVTRNRKVPRRSTLILLKSGEEVGRLIAQTGEEDIKELLEQAVSQ
tara:strand:- start:42029 stop:42253 length:225 start_codon:yes stop_codon:yes gene_type:complete